MIASEASVAKSCALGPILDIPCLHVDRAACTAAKFVGTTIEGSNFEVAITKAFAVQSVAACAKLWQMKLATCDKILVLCRDFTNTFLVTMLTTRRSA